MLNRDQHMRFQDWEAFDSVNDECDDGESYRNQKNMRWKVVRVAPGSACVVHDFEQLEPVGCE
jgi:hypothetical protein